MKTLEASHNSVTSTCKQESNDKSDKPNTSKKGLILWVKTTISWGKF